MLLPYVCQIFKYIRATGKKAEFSKRNSPSLCQFNAIFFKNVGHLVMESILTCVRSVPSATDISNSCQNSVSMATQR